MYVSTLTDEEHKELINATIASYAHVTYSQYLKPKGKHNTPKKKKRKKVKKTHRNSH
jgi:hypothetical protein